MLHKETVAQPTLELLTQLMMLPELSTFSLVGGTNLALRLGHRISVDIDLFTTDSFDLLETRLAMTNAFSNVVELGARGQTLLYQINGIKTDMIRHQYKQLYPVEIMEGIRLASTPDVVAMKLGAVAGRGAKKDFWDIYALLREFSIKEMVAFYAEKYPASDPGQVVRSLVYFEDAEPQPDPIDLLNTTWEDVKASLRNQLKIYMKSIL